MVKFENYSVHILDNSLIEIILENDFEVTLDMVQEFVHYIKDKVDTPYSVLFNKASSVSYQLDALHNIYQLPGLDKVAIVNHDATARKSSEFLVSTYSQGDSIRLFDSREAALDWLQHPDDVKT